MNAPIPTVPGSGLAFCVGGRGARPRMRRRAQKARPDPGFSLLELLVAMAVFAVIALLAWSGLDTLARNRHVLAAERARLSALQQTVGQLERDLRQAVARPARDASGLDLPALLGQPSALELTRLAPGSGWQSPLPVLERIGWRCSDGELQRLRWAVPDRAANTRSLRETRLAGVTDCQWRYLDRVPSATWPPRGAALERLPRAVELRFTLDGVGELRRVIELADNAAEAGA